MQRNFVHPFFLTLLPIFFREIYFLEINIFGRPNIFWIHYIFWGTNIFLAPDIFRRHNIFGGHNIFWIDNIFGGIHFWYLDIWILKWMKEGRRFWTKDLRQIYMTFCPCSKTRCFGFHQCSSGSSDPSYGNTWTFQHFQHSPCSRSVYPFTTPGAFVPHSAINLSRTKEEESPVSQSLDLSVSEAPAVSSAGAWW